MYFKNSYKTIRLNMIIKLKKRLCRRMTDQRQLQIKVVQRKNQYQRDPVMFKLADNQTMKNANKN